MHVKSFLRVGNLYVVPVLRQRLVFASIVRDALHHLSEEAELDGADDLLCVSLPRSMAPKMLECIDLLPVVTQIWVWDSTQTGREVFAITPCDAFVETMRCGIEQGVQVDFVDAELRAGNILRSPCERHPDWMDDSLAQILGVDTYRQAVASAVTTPPFRRVPIDAWREAVIVQRLRHLTALWRRVVLVCDMSIVDNILRGLSTESAWRGELPDIGVPSRVTVQRTLNLPALLNQLDDYPRIVEAFENLRWKDERFDKRQMLMEEISKFIARTSDITRSTRQFDKFSAFLANLLQAGGRHCPEPSVLYYAMLGCFGRPLAERLHCHLAGYFDQVSVERVRPRSFADRGSFRYALDISSAEGGFGARECQPFPMHYEVTERIRPAPLGGGDHSEYAWPAELGAIRDANRKLSGLMLATAPLRRSRMFEGSVEGGIDIRRSLRSSLTGAPALFVKRFVREPEHVDIEKSPVVWVLRNEIGQSKFSVESHGYYDERKFAVEGRKPGENYFVASQDFLFNPDDYAELARHALKINSEGNVELLGAPRFGRITFGIQFRNDEEARKAYGAEFEQRVPNHADFEHPGDFGCIHSSLTEMLEDEPTWFEIAFLTALRYASKTIVVVMPAALVLPAGLALAAMRAGVEPVFVSLEKFSRQEQDRLRTTYRLFQKEGQKFSPEYFRRLMAQFWT